MDKSKENQIPNSPESSFSNRSVKSRRFKKMMNALPKSPKKRNEIVQTLSWKFNLRIALHSKNSGRPENNLSEAKVERLCQFMNRPNITCKNAGKKINDILVKRIAKASSFLFVTIYGQ